MDDTFELFDTILFRVFGANPKIESFFLVSGGQVNQSISLITSQGTFFLKMNQDSHPDIFAKEREGLKLMAANTSVYVPEVYGTGSCEGYNYILMEWIPETRQSKEYWEILAVGMAELHMATSSHFGLDHHNYISVLPQKNNNVEDWSSFFMTCRLAPLVKRAQEEGLIDQEIVRRVEEIYPRLSSIFPRERPALLHGDLWAGNVMVGGKGGGPVLIDPAVYFGHREMDLAFSHLFGGFSQVFYNSYSEVFPLEQGFDDRKEVYNLYPLLVHLYLFGSSYLPPILRTVDRFR